MEPLKLEMIPDLTPAQAREHLERGLKLMAGDDYGYHLVPPRELVVVIRLLMRTLEPK